MTSSRDPIAAMMSHIGWRLVTQQASRENRARSKLTLALPRASKVIVAVLFFWQQTLPRISGKTG
ncbi:hypothetical protein [Bradyrhizobium embrapense]|uniref:hypothetical protein n=1 Tax=Bradyrhizobium embrapense TaxID=630921 RepID=UPI0012F4FF97|nr:hypothetical protein [Bradyrhizobium embrapense]